MFVDVVGFESACAEHFRLIVVTSFAPIGVHVDAAATLHLVHMVDDILCVVCINLRWITPPAMLAFSASLSIGQTTNGVVGNRLSLRSFIVLLGIVAFGCILRTIDRSLIGMVVVDIFTRSGHRGIG